jgi:hypothetical protein
MGIKIQNLFKLVSREDPTNIHKFLGILCLLNFIYQFSCLFTTGDMHLQNNPYAPLLIGFHGLLALSSFIFHVPLKRHKGLPMIYKEYRFHTVAFSLRSVACSLVFYYGLDVLYNILIINITMILADLATNKYGSNTKTMREIPYGKEISEDDKKKITYMTSCQQFAATMFMVCNINSAFSPLLAIQMAAFLKTLVRKAIITELDWHRVYVISLWVNIFVYQSFSNFSDSLFIIFGINAFDFLRIKKGCNKYLAWNSIFGLLYLIKNYTDFQNYVEINKMYKELFVNAVIVIYLVRNFYKSKALWI